jgi:hypothetical protein
MNKVIDAWYAGSLLFFIGLQLYFHLMLWHNGRVKWNNIYAGTPGYLDVIYVRWRKAQDKPYIGLIFFRILADINIVLAFAAFVITTPR